MVVYVVKDGLAALRWYYKSLFACSLGSLLCSSMVPFETVALAKLRHMACFATHGVLTKVNCEVRLC